jgi:hypothetical protein
MPTLIKEKKALSMLQPWASLLTLGIKRTETRSFKIWKDFRGRLYIHASTVRKKDYAAYYLRDTEFRSYVNMAYEKLHGGRPAGVADQVNAEGPYDYVIPWARYRKAWPTQAIIGHVVVTDCLEAFDYKAQLESAGKFIEWDREFTLGDLSSDRFAWICSGHADYTPSSFPIKGALGLWDIDKRSGCSFLSDLLAKR